MVVHLQPALHAVFRDNRISCSANQGYLILFFVIIYMKLPESRSDESPVFLFRGTQDYSTWRGHPARDKSI